jgi:probable rRNA maturation factor
MIDVEIEEPAWLEAAPDAAALALAAARCAAGDRDFTILLTGDAEVAELNLRFRQERSPTNVLSFPALENRDGYLGDVALALGVCSREAGEQNKTLGDHLAHLVIHGVLHLLGYDHQEDIQAQRMESLERDLLARLGVADPYGQGDHVHQQS